MLKKQIKNLVGRVFELEKELEKGVFIRINNDENSTNMSDISENVIEKFKDVKKTDLNILVPRVIDESKYKGGVRSPGSVDRKEVSSQKLFLALISKFITKLLKHRYGYIFHVYHILYCTYCVIVNIVL